ncbi:hypothetical protein SAMN05421819_3784 [Bryocella elongata]|uniref:Uncharacterized protein n=1 Tax=Bryocella elongata TaxID=863522 RepID=A0A1H6BL99_9BACT|nr:hypothetical protein [Bryocella elongata]SEG61157.1 hypothetical protein SAMN05421819_3784 [Bryocella elongata]
MDAAIFFLPIALVVAQYFTSYGQRRQELARAPQECGDPCNS